MKEKQILVLGLVSPLGTKLDEFQNKAKRFIEARYDAKVHTIALSELMLRNFSEELNSVEFLKTPRLRQLKRKIELGNLLRREYDRQEIFAEFALLKISDIYKSILTSPSKKHFIFVDQLKRHEEARFLEQIFGDAFWLLGLESPVECRIQQLTKSNEELQSEAEKLIFTDENEENNQYGQRMRKAFLRSHVVFSDEFEEHEAERFFDLLHGSHFVLPSQDEYFMNLAFNSSLKTGDLSRQVGAVIVSEGFDQISCGANEVNKFGGGSYWSSGESHSDLNRRLDPNKKIIQEIKEELKNRIVQSGLDVEEASALLEKSKIDDLTEFHRATHAEMDAILSAHRNGISTVGSTIYCTTFPCHNCAKHIISAGIKKIVYQEPYPKSLALRLHDDSISREPAKNKAHLSYFKGITHSRFCELFSLTYSTGKEVSRKIGGTVRDFDPKNAEFRFQISIPIFSRLSPMALETFKENGSIRLDKIA